jgi:hypothetical protein
MDERRAWDSVARFSLLALASVHRPQTRYGSTATGRRTRTSTGVCRHHSLRCRGPSVPVVQPAYSPHSPHLARPRWPGLDRAAGRRFLTESDMGPVLVIVADVLMAKPQQMSFVQRDDVIQHLTSAAANPSFRDSVLPGTANACPNGVDPARAFKNSRTSLPNLRSRSNRMYRYGHGNGSASRNCCTIQSLVGCVVALK